MDFNERTALTVDPSSPLYRALAMTTPGLRGIKMSRRYTYLIHTDEVIRYLTDPAAYAAYVKWSYDGEWTLTTSDFKAPHTNANPEADDPLGE
ncbi:hypothetical protein AYO44_18165 [Planctomycetaceae bacterium SCGC AG-212-F19]|nr:hypothetical protein AYO44_18165 [Planctomycetaceae bacterium SCGC AG-212-F19]